MATAKANAAVKSLSHTVAAGYIGAMRETEKNIACDHCGLPVPAGLIEPEANRQFCCGGCQVAYETIHACGLDEFYQVRDRLAGKNQAAATANSRYAAYDSDVFLATHALTTTAGLQSVELRLEGVHCAACVWLVERLPHVIDGVVEARLVLGASLARITWNPKQVPLSQVAKTLDQLGYPPHPARDTTGRQARNLAERKRLIRMAVAGALAGNCMLIAVALYAGLFDGIEPRFLRLFRWLSLAIGWVALLWPGEVFFRGAWAALRTRTANLDLPIALALGVGAIAGTANVLLDRGEVYFDSLSVLVFLLLVGRFLQSRQQRWAEDSVGLMLSLTPLSCRVLRDGTLVEEPVESLAAGDEVEIRSGDLFPADGEVVSGESASDQSLLTGESVPQPVALGDAVYAGAQNVGSTLRVTVTVTGEATRVGKLMRLVEEGSGTKPQVVEFADRVGGWFVLVVSVLALLNFAVWSMTVGLAPAIDSSVALLIVACPCALGLATPLTMAIAIGAAAKFGVLVKDARALESLGRVGKEKHSGRMLLDKTGTLTMGRPQVTAWNGPAWLQPLVAAIERESNHPLARALVAAYQNESVTAPPMLTDREESLNGGVSARCTKGLLQVGSPTYIQGHAIALSNELLESIQEGEATGCTVVVVAIDNEALATVWLRDEPRDDVALTLQQIKQSGWHCEIVSGDAAGPVAKVAQQVGIPASETSAGVTPEGKLQRVRDLLTLPSADRPTVVMVGDGVNDAAALAAADVGIAVSGGAEASLAAADVYVREPGMAPLARLTRLSAQTLHVVRRNLVISLAYNMIAVSLAAAGWITPLVAALLMPLSSATVLASAAMGLSSSPPTPPTETP